MEMRIIDLHNDAVVFLSRRKLERYILKAWKNGVRLIVLSVWTTEMKDPMKRIKTFRRIIDDLHVPVKLLLHIEDAWFLNEGNIGELIACRPFSVGLTWNENNALAGGANSEGMLTTLGKTVIEQFVANDIKIDFAHLNKQSFFEVAKILTEHKQKLMCSHTCFCEIHMHARNLDHEQIKTIVDSDGIIGLTFVGSFLTSSKRVKINDVINHIKYFLQNFGENNIAIGSDFYGTKNLPQNLRGYKSFRKLKKLLMSKGLTEQMIDKIFFLNAEKFFMSYI